MPHFILYPALQPGCFLCLSSISYDEILDKSKSWDKEKPLIESSELSRLYDLTDNDIIIRQINCSQILERLLSERVKEFNKNPIIAQKSTFDFEKDFYGKQGFYACKNGIGTRIMAFVFCLLYKPYKFSIDLHIYFNKLEMLNTFVIFKKKQYQMEQCAYYLRVLKHEKPHKNYNMFDFHFYKLAIYLKFSALLTQMVLDIIFGILFLVYLQYQTTNALIVLHWIG